MGRITLTALIAAWAIGSAGCMTAPLLDNPLVVRLDPNAQVSNPVWVPGGGPDYYGKVFERIIDVLDDYFEISYANRYDGHIETFPRIAPGFEQFWKPGSPDAYQRLQATWQTIRHRAAVVIQPAEDGGFFVQITVYKELEDLPRPTQMTAGAAAFRSDPTLERQFEVIDPTVFESNWIPQGRNAELEQVILQRIKKCL
jgi:hypothetical protein